MDYQRVYGDSSRFDYDPIAPRQPSPSPPSDHVPSNHHHSGAMPPPVTSRLDPNYHYYVSESRKVVEEVPRNRQQPPSASQPVPQWYNDEMRRPEPVAKDPHHAAHAQAQAQARRSQEVVQETPYNTSHYLENPQLPSRHSSGPSQATAATAAGGDDLPKMMEPSEYQGYQYEPQVEPPPPPITKEEQRKHDLVKQVMSSTFIFHQQKQIDQGKVEDTEYTVSGLGVLLVFEMIFGIISTTLSAILLDRDNKVTSGWYRYILADSVISLAIALLFLTRAINYESRNGVFYSVLATVFKTISFGMVIGVVLPQQDCESNICPMRRALAAFIIISTFLWVINLVVFLTTLYVAKMDIWDKYQRYQPIAGGELPPQMTPAQAAMPDMSQHAIPSPHVEQAPPPQQRPFTPPMAPPPPKSEASDMNNEYYSYPEKKAMKEYFLTEDNEMYEMEPDVDITGKQRVVLYF